MKIHEVYLLKIERIQNYTLDNIQFKYCYEYSSERLSVGVVTCCCGGVVTVGVANDVVVG